ncbi:MAG: type II secretion system F family protein [Litorilinea sp.]
MNYVLIITLLIMFAVIAAMAGFYRWLSWTREVESRLTDGAAPAAGQSGQGARLADQMNKRINKLSFAERLDKELTAADSNMTVMEFLMTRAALAFGLFVGGWLLSGHPAGGVLLGLIGWMVPGMNLQRKKAARLKAFGDQLPDMISMITGSLRSGYGLMQAITVIEHEMPNPMAAEFGRVVRETALGYPIAAALDNLVERMQNDDLRLVVTAIHIQNEVGGSLADVLETITGTIQDRIELLGKVRALTAQGRITGMLLSGLPILVGAALMVINPEYILSMFQPGWILALPIVAVIMIVMGNILMTKVTKIQV